MPASTLTAKTRTTCTLCQVIVPIGGDIYAVEGSDGLFHPACAVAHCQAEGCPCLPPICKHFVRRGYCLFEDKCFYRHPEDLQASRPCKKVKLRGAITQTKVRNRFRSATFRRFLIQTFGRERLAQGSGVLDIAGGTGELSFELVNLNKLAATVIDPRPQLKLDRARRWLKAGFYFRNPVFQAFVDAQWSEFRGGDNACTPAHLRMLLTSELAQRLARAPPAAVPQPDSCRPGPESSADGPWIEGGTTAIDDEARQSGAACNCSREALHEQRAADAADGQAAAGEGGDDVGGESKELLLCLQGAFNQAASIRWTHQALQTGGHEGGQSWTEDSCSALPGEDEDSAQGEDVLSAPAEAFSAEQLRDVACLWKNASIVVGMHPDQATEPIVEFARLTGKPFAVVPCCVFPKEFPMRCLDRQPVRVYDEFIQYLVSLAPEHIQVADLMFEGRNKVVFCQDWAVPYALQQQNQHTEVLPGDGHK